MKNRFLVFQLLFFLLPLAARGYASEDKLAISGFGDLLGLVNTDYGVSVVDGRLDLQFHLSPFTLGIDYRCYDFGEGRYNPAGIERFNGIRHRFAEVSHNDFLIRAGHTSITFARGLALRSLEERQLEHDNLIDGVFLKYTNWELSLDALGGAEVERIGKTQTIEHRVRGIRLSRRFGTALDLGLCSIERTSKKQDRERELPPDLADFEDRLSGVDFSFNHPNLSILGDYVFREGDSYRSGTHGIEGHGFYGSLTVLLRGISFLGEYKDYWDFDHALSMGPTCIKEHTWSLMSRVTHEPDYYDEKGFLFEAMAYPWNSVHLTGGASESRKHNHRLNHWEIFSEIEISDRSPIKAIGFSFSREYRTFAETQTFTEYATLTSEVEIKPMGRPCLIDLEMQRAREPFMDRFFNYFLSATLYPHDLISAAIRIEASEERQAKRDLWMFGEMRIELPDQGEIGLGLGSERGGKKCSGGICYIEPEFAGVRVRYSRYF